MGNQYGRMAVGNKYSTNYRVYVTSQDRIISPFHDIPSFIDESHINVVNEIPRFENAKFEVCKEKAMNPIIQDVKDGKPRFVANIFPCKGYPWNYGAIPQTWEDPNVRDSSTNCSGDNDPLDVIEIGNIKKDIGEVYAAKIIGCLGLIDSGECDWKILVIDSRDENAKNINNINDLKMIYPHLQNVTYNWFRDYKIPDNKPRNKFLDYGELKDKKFACGIIKECHKSWNKLMNIQHETEISRINSTRNKFNVSSFEIESVEDADAMVPEYINGYFYVKEN